jgi:hypothetical protein
MTRPVKPTFEIFVSTEELRERLDAYYIDLAEYERWAAKRENETAHVLKGKAYAKLEKSWSSAASQDAGRRAAEAALRDYPQDVSAARHVLETARSEGWSQSMVAAVAGWVGDVALALDPMAWFELSPRPPRPPRGSNLFRLFKGWGMHPGESL